MEEEEWGTLKATFECIVKHEIRFHNFEVGINLKKIYVCSSWVPIHQLVVQNKVPYSKWIGLNTQVLPTLLVAAFHSAPKMQPSK